MEKNISVFIDQPMYLYSRRQICPEGDVDPLYIGLVGKIESVPLG